MKYYITDNTAPAVPLSEIPEASYAEFYADQAAKLADARYHIACLLYTSDAADEL